MTIDALPALDRERLWPHLVGVLARGPGWIALDKPLEVGERHPLGPGNDLRTRLSRAEGLPQPDLQLLLPPITATRRARGHEEARCSGVCLVATDAEAQRSLRELPLTQRWLVGLEGFPALADGVIAGLDALGARLRVRERAGARALVEVTAAGHEPVDWVGELRRRGCRVAGAGRPVASPDGRPPSPRLPFAMLHRAHVQLGRHAWASPEPPRFGRWLRGEAAPLPERLRQALRRRYGLAHSAGLDAWRLFDDESTLTLDAYGPDLVLSSYDALPDPIAAPEALADAVARARRRAQRIGELLGARSVWLKLRPRQANHIVDAGALGLVPGEPVWGEAPGEAIVEESGVRYRIQLGAGLSTGIFLDQRDNRAWVQRNAAGLRVLNTFSYTCGFSVAAAVGGARRTVSLDAAAPALAWGRTNLALNGHDDPERHDTLRGDVFAWLPRMARRGDRFDLVVLDPPSYAKVRRRRFAAARDYGDLVAAACAVLDPGGTLLCCINHAGVGRRRLEQMVRDGCRQARRSVASLHHQRPGVDHPGGRMKSVRVRLD